MSEPTATDKEGERIQSIDQLAKRQEQTDSKLDELLGKVDRLLGGGGTDPKASPAGSQSSASASPSAGSVEEQVLAELARRDKAKADQDAADAEKKDREDVKAELARLRETPPRPAARRATKLLGWGDGR